MPTYLLFLHGYLRLVFLLRPLNSILDIPINWIRNNNNGHPWKIINIRNRKKYSTFLNVHIQKGNLPGMAKNLNSGTSVSFKLLIIWSLVGSRSWKRFLQRQNLAEQRSYVKRFTSKCVNRFLLINQYLSKKFICDLITLVKSYTVLTA